MDGLSAPTGTCSPGFYCIEGSIYYKPYDYASGRICAQGHYCTLGLEYDCLDGYYAPVEGLALCYSCPPGFYCNAAGGTITPLECTTGNYCPKETGTPKQCPDGTYTQSYQLGLESKDQCSSCPSGYFCNDGTFDRSNKCKKGYYCHSEAFEEDEYDNRCPTGYFCEEGTKLPTACPDGTYSLRGAVDEDDCTDCLAGFYCVRYSTASAMIICPVGYYCPDGVDAPIPCSKGKYNTYERSTSEDKCIDCPAGTACDVTGIADYKRKMCPAGYYCEKGTISPQSCPAGTFRPNQGAAKAGPTDFVVNASAD